MARAEDFHSCVSVKNMIGTWESLGVMLVKNRNGGHGSREGRVSVKVNYKMLRLVIVWCRRVCMDSRWGHSTHIQEI